MQGQRDPRTKRELVDRLTSMTFNGDLRTLGARGADVLRSSPQSITLQFKDSGQLFELRIRKPNESRQGVNTRARATEGEGRSFEPSETEDEWVAAPSAKKRKGIRPDEPRQRAAH